MEGRSEKVKRGSEQAAGQEGVGFHELPRFRFRPGFKNHDRRSHSVLAAARHDHGAAGDSGGKVLEVFGRDLLVLVGSGVEVGGQFRAFTGQKDIEELKGFFAGHV